MWWARQPPYKAAFLERFRGLIEMLIQRVPTKMPTKSPTGRRRTFANRMVRGINWLLDDGLIEVGFAYHDGDVNALKVSGILLQELGRSILHFGDNI
jgi:hypothetical protein